MKTPILYNFTGLIFLIVFMSGCTHTVAFQELNYDVAIDKKSENIIVVIDKNTLESTVSIRSMKAGLINRWDAQPGIMLKQVADIEFPQIYNHYIFSNSLIEPPWKENTFQLVMTIPEYQFKHSHTYYSVGISVFKEHTKLFEKRYQEEGFKQGAKMFWAGAFGMKSAIRQSSLDALKKIFSKIRADINKLFVISPLNSNKDINKYYIPQNAVDSFENGDYEYYFPQD